MDSTFSILLTAAAFIMGIMLLTGHGEIFMKGGNAETRNKIYDQAKMEKVTGVTMLLVAVVSAIDIFTTAFAAKVAYIVVIIMIFVGMVIYMRKNCRK